ncbi:MAG: hypothetical protein AMXMBFR57_20200 [Acidimicrobiia bacterium]
MPTCYVTVSEDSPELSEHDLLSIRDIVAEALNSGARLLDREHIVLRLQRGRRTHMLGDIELEVFCQFFIRRFFSRDRRAEQISARVKDLVSADCATWINMMVVGYSRVDVRGRSFFSDKASQASPRRG